MTGWPGAFHLYRSYVSQLFHFFHFPHRFSKNPTVFHSGRQSEGFSKVGTGVGGIVCVSGLPGRWVLGRMALWCILLTLPSRKFLLYGSLLHPSPFFISVTVLFPYFSPVSPPSFRKGAFHLKWHSNRFFNGELSLQTFSPWVCGQSLLFWFSGDSHL